MTEYYKSKLASGLEFQDYCAIQFSKIGIPITSFSSTKYQYEKGENLQGFEFKNDEIFRSTGNLWIEVKERTNINNEYVNSGIFRSDNTKFYVMGDYEGVFIMQKKVLQALSKKYKAKENNMKTSIGFLFPVKRAKELFDYIEFKKPQEND